MRNIMDCLKLYATADYDVVAVTAADDHHHHDHDRNHQIKLYIL